MIKRVTIQWKSKFARFIKAYSVESLAVQLDVSPSAICQWIRGATTPRPGHAAVMQRLVRERRLKLTLDEVYRHSRDLRIDAARDAKRVLLASMRIVGGARVSHLPAFSLASTQRPDVLLQGVHEAEPKRVRRREFIL